MPDHDQAEQTHHKFVMVDNYDEYADFSWQGLHRH